MTPPSPLLVLLLVLAAGGPSLSPAHALPDSPAHDQDSYSFAYAVDAAEYRNFHDREEARRGEETRGRFRVALPDNRLQTVTYRANGNGYTASISYDQHPNFESLRQSVGPIRSGPEIGQSVLDGIRRGENWKNHKGPKDDSRPELGSSLGGHGTSSNFVVPTPTRTRLTPTRTRPAPSPTRPVSTHPRLTPTRTRPVLTNTNTPSRITRPRPAHTNTNTPSRIARPRPAHTNTDVNTPSRITRPRPAHTTTDVNTPSRITRPRPAHTNTDIITPSRITRPRPAHTNTDINTPSRITRPRSGPRPSRRRPTTTRRPSPSKTTPRRTAAASSPPPRTGNPPRTPSPSLQPNTIRTLAPTLSPGDSENSAILTRLIEAIEEKLAAEGPVQVSGGPPHPKKPYSIADRESVRKRLEAVVHPAKY